jgi:O-antigen/teichoic acid export membrane protein
VDIFQINPPLAQLIFNNRMFLFCVPAITSAYLFSGFFKAANLPNKATIIEPGNIALVTAIGIEGYFLLSINQTHEIEARMLIFGNFYVGTLWAMILLALVWFWSWRRMNIQAKSLVQNCEGLPHLKKYFQISASFMTISLTEMVQNGLMIIIIGMILVEQKVGLFRVAERIATLIGFMLIVLNSILPPLIVRYFGAKNIYHLEKSTRFYTKLSTLFGCVIALPLLIVPETILSLFGNEFSNAAPILQILSLGQLVLASNGASIMILKMTDHLSLARNISLYANLLFIPFFYAAITYQGLIAGSITVLIWGSAQHLLATYFVKSKLGIQILPFLPPMQKEQAR